MMILLNDTVSFTTKDRGEVTGRVVFIYPDGSVRVRVELDGKQYEWWFQADEVKVVEQPAP